MKRYIPTFLLVLCAWGMSASSLNAKTFRWTDESGKVHYSQSIPPSAAQNGHKEIRKGVVIDSVGSREEREQRQAQQAKQKQQDAKRRKQAREELMLFMFSSEAELSEHFTKRISMISTNVRLLQFHKQRMKKNVENLRVKLDKATNEKIRKNLTKQMLDTQRNLLEHTQAIERNQQEQVDIKVDMDRALALYRKKHNGEEVADNAGLDGLIEGHAKSSEQAKTQPSGCDCKCNAEVSLMEKPK